MKSKLSQYYLYFAVFSSGLTILAIELTATHLLGTIFGTSNLVTASIVGLILIYLTIGYFLGGRWADRWPQARKMYSLMAWGAFTIGLVPLVSTPVLNLAWSAFDQLAMPALFGSFMSVLLLFSIPVTLLGAVSPYAIRLAIHDTRRAGEIAGLIYAISTLGSFVGTFLPSLLVVPAFGTRMTFLIFSSFLVAVALVGLGISAGWRYVIRYLWMPMILVLVGILLTKLPIKSTAGQIFETESAYNYIQVLEENGYRKLRLNEGQGVHSMWHPEELYFGGPWEQFLAGPFFNTPPVLPDQVNRIAIVGLAAGTTARQATAVFGAVPIDGYEIDPKIIEVGRDYFEMNEPNLNAAAQDGRIGLKQSQERYSLIVVDAYRPPYIPTHLTTQEFFQIVKDRLTEDGVVAINVGRSPADRSLINGMVGTLQSIFPSVHVMDIPETFNSIIYATVQPTSWDNLYTNLASLYTRPDTHPLLLKVMEQAVLSQQPTPMSKIVFTDDHAPIEWITNRMILSYILYGDMESLR